MRATLVVAVLVVVYPGVVFAQLAPQSQAEFEQRFTGWTAHVDAPDCNEGRGVEPITFIEPGRVDDASGIEGDYEYERTGANTGTLTITLDFIPIPQAFALTFNSQTMGTFTVAVFGLVACEGSFEFVDASGTSDLTSYKYIFPQFAFGGGWESTLMVQALGSNTTCIFSAQDRSFTMRDPYGNNLSGTQQQLILGMNGWTILKTATPQGMAASSGMAVLDCDEEVSANTLFSLEVGGSLVAEALVESSEEIVSGEPAAQFLADHRDGARFAVAVANPSNQPLDVLIAVGDLGGQQIGEVTVTVPANAGQAFFVDELVTIPTGHTGQVSIRPSNNPGPSVYVVGLRVTGLVITTIPAIVLRPDPPTTGLNTHLTDPNGQWTATAQAKIIEKNDTYWEFSYFVDMTNRTDEEQEYTVTVHFVDADGFSVEDSYAGEVFNKIPAKSTKRLLDRALIDTENAPTVVGILLEVNVQ